MRTIFSIGSFVPYLAIYYILPGDTVRSAALIGAVSTGWQGTILLLAGAVSWTAGRVGKHRALQFFLVVALLGNLAKWFCHSPGPPWLCVIPPMCFAAGFTALWTLASLLTADICETERQVKSVDDGGMFAGVYVWMIKLGSTLAFTAAGMLLNSTGIDVAYGARQPSPVRFEACDTFGAAASRTVRVKPVSFLDDLQMRSHAARGGRQ